MRASLLALVPIACLGACLCACRSGSVADGADAGDASAAACEPVVPKTEAGTCPVMPPNGMLCDLSDIASGWCFAADCPASASCCSYGTRGGEACFPVCGACGTGIPRQVACMPEGSCTTDADCHGSLPHICQTCALGADGQPSQGCAHWVCEGGQCQVGYCAPGLVCPGGQGCPAYYLPSLDRSCSADGDCVLVTHAASCHVTVETAVRATAQQHFIDVERQCTSIQQPLFCGAPAGVVTEDGATAGPGQSFAAACVAGTCKAVVTGRLQCGTTTCDPGQSCCVAPGHAGQCVYSCATSCTVVTNDAGAAIACGGPVSG